MFDQGAFLEEALAAELALKKEGKNGSAIDHYLWRNNLYHSGSRDGTVPVYIRYRIVTILTN